MAQTAAERQAKSRAKKVANETPEEKEQRLAKQRAVTTKSRAKNGRKPRVSVEVTLPTSTRPKTQAERNAKYMKKKKENETPEQREARLKSQPERTARSRAKNGRKPRVTAEVTIPKHSGPMTSQQCVDFSLRVQDRAYAFVSRMQEKANEAIEDKVAL